MTLFSRYRVVVELKRVQSYLFNVPKLRTILGANAVIGEVLRISLPKLAAGYSAEVFPGQLELDNSDPITCLPKEWEGDNPLENYKKGVLTRDGGHLQILFDDINLAKEFKKRAREKMKIKLPDLMHEIKLEEWFPSTSTQPGNSEKALHAGWIACGEGVAQEIQSVDFPDECRIICPLSGQGLATDDIEIGPQTMQVSKRVATQWNAGTRFRNKETRDIVGLLQKYSTLPCLEDGWASADDLEKLAGGAGRYLALIHVDGNGVGKRRPISGQSLRDGETPKEAFGRWLASEAEVESFFYSMRANVRAALVKSLSETFSGCVSSSFARITPYQLLMVGGDDVLLIMQANYAIPWFIRYAEELAETNLSDGKPLDVGAGIVIAKPNFPFHTLHELADELASSAKRLSRGQGNQGRSVVDWLVLSESATLGIDRHRRLHDIVRYDAGTHKETLITNARPYFVLPPETNAEEVPKQHTLKSLWDTAQSLQKDEDKAARSQRKSLPGALRQGRLAGEAAIWDLPDDLREQIEKFVEGDSIWKCIESTKTDASASHTYLTHLVDMLELCEISELGARRSSKQDGKGDSDGEQ